MYSIWGKFAVSPCCVSSKKLYISTHSYSLNTRGLFVLPFFTRDATHRRNCSTTFAWTSRLLSGGAGLWAYKLDQKGFEEWVWDQNKGGKEYHCWKTPRHVNRAITLCFSAHNNMLLWFSHGTQWNGLAEHINFALVGMTVLQLPFIVLDANLMQSIPLSM